MSSQTAGPNVFRRLREPAALYYLVMTGAVVSHALVVNVWSTDDPVLPRLSADVTR